MGVLRIPVGMAVTLLGLAVSLQAVTRRIEQFTHQSAAHLVALLLQRFGQSSHAFAGAPQRRSRIRSSVLRAARIFFTISKRRGARTRREPVVTAAAPGCGR